MKSNNELINSILFDANYILRSDLNGIIKEDFNAGIVDDKGRTPLMFFLQILIEDMEQFRDRKKSIIDKYDIDKIKDLIMFLYSKSKDNLGHKDSDGRSLLSYVSKLRLLLTMNFFDELKGNVKFTDWLFSRPRKISSLCDGLDGIQESACDYYTQVDFNVLRENMSNLDIETKYKSKSGLMKLAFKISNMDLVKSKKLVAKAKSMLPNAYKYLADSKSKLLNEWKEYSNSKDNELSKLNNMQVSSIVGISISSAALIVGIVCLAAIPMKGFLLAVTISSLLLSSATIGTTGYFIYRFCKEIAENRQSNYDFALSTDNKIKSIELDQDELKVGSTKLEEFSKYLNQFEKTLEIGVKYD